MEVHHRITNGLQWVAEKRILLIQNGVNGSESMDAYIETRLR